jgi:hypothetical protein
VLNHKQERTHNFLFLAGPCAIMVGDETDFNSAKEKIQQNFLMVFSFLVWN